MTEYINKQALLAEYDCVHVGPPGGARKLIEEAPAADVVPVVHGRWVYDFTLGGSNFYRCSVCNRQEVLLEKEDIVEWCPYCHCGARMDGE